MNYAWAIETCDSEVKGLIGKYWWFKGMFEMPSEHFMGYRVACFATRKAARANLKSVKDAFPKARVVKVRVTVEIVGVK